MKKRCPYCQGDSVRKEGFYTNGKQRWFCKSCKRSFSWKNTRCKYNRERIWFKRWITEGYSVRQLSEQSGHSKAKLYRIINYWLADPPVIEHELKGHQYLIFDGSFLHRPISVITLLDACSGTVISGKYGVRESLERDVLAFFQSLIIRGLDPISCTLDGNPLVIKVIKTIWPDITIQRCIIHVQRQGISWCRSRPHEASAKRLRELFLKIASIATKEERDTFIISLAAWEEKYGCDIASHPERGRVFSDIKRARSMLLKALPDMFHYLDNPAICRSTNGLESYFSRLKSHYRAHRGLTKRKLANYFKWYLFYKPK